MGIALPNRSSATLLCRLRKSTAARCQEHNVASKASLRDCLISPPKAVSCCASSGSGRISEGRVEAAASVTAAATAASDGGGSSRQANACSFAAEAAASRPSSHTAGMLGLPCTVLVVTTQGQNQQHQQCLHLRVIAVQICSMVTSNSFSSLSFNHGVHPTRWNAVFRWYPTPSLVKPAISDICRPGR